MDSAHTSSHSLDVTALEPASSERVRVSDGDIRAFRAATIHEALQAVRRALGDEAVVFETRSVASSADPSERGSTQIEVLAGVRPPNDPPTSSAAPPAIAPTARETDPSTVRPAVDRKPSNPARHPVDFDLDETRLSDRLSAIEQALQSLTRERRGHGPIIDRLVSRGVPLAVTRQVVGDAIGDDPSLPPSKDALVESLAGTLRTVEPPTLTAGRQSRVALIGPTGVGKTTTLAKIAANSRIEQRQRVGLITIDDYRVAAADQLRTYADLLQCPVHIVTTDDEMDAAVDALAECDLIMVDTPGFGRPDDEQMDLLVGRLDRADVTNRYLVLSTVSALASSRMAATRYSPLRPTALIATKLDETVEPGVMAGLSSELSTPLMYVTTGQDVPADIEAADAHTLARRILEQPVVA